MTQQIPPSGLKLNEYPPVNRTARQVRLVDLLKLVAELKATRAATKEKAMIAVRPFENFFLGQFGLGYWDEMVSRYLYNPDKTTKGVKSGSKAHRDIASTMLAYKDPDIPPGLTREKLILLVAALIRWDDLGKEILTKEVALFEEASTSFMRMEVPIPAQILYLKDAPKFTLDISRKVPASSPSAWVHKSRVLNSDLLSKEKWFQPYIPGNPKYAEGLGQASRKYGLTVKKVSGRVFLSKQVDEVILYPWAFWIYHWKSIADKPTPTGFWSHVARYRLTALSAGSQRTEVYLVEVNPHTGAAYNKGMLVATSSKLSPSDALGVVSTFFPYVSELSSKENPKITGLDISHESSGLTKSAAQWKGTGRKAERQYVTVVETYWDWADKELSKDNKWFQAFNSGNSYSYRPTPTQTKLLEFRSEDPTVARAAIISGNPPNSIRHLLFGGTHEQMKDTFPVSYATFYILPEGTEAALERLCGTDNNVIAAEFHKKLSNIGISIENAPYANTAPVSKERFEAMLKDCADDMRGIMAVLSSPYLYTEGYEYVLARGSIAATGVRIDSKVKGRLRKYFQAAKWPTGKAQKAFRAPINDKADVQIMRGKFVKSLKESGGQPPLELSYPEAPNLKVQYTPILNGDAQAVSWRITTVYGYPFNSAESIKADRGLLSYYNQSSSPSKLSRWRTKYVYRDMLSARGISSRKRIHTPEGLDMMTTMSSEAMPVENIAKAQERVSNTELAVGGGTIAFAGLLAALYVAHKGGKRNSLE